MSKLLTSYSNIQTFKAMADSLSQINTDIIDCKRCPRLIPYIQEVAENKVRRFREWDYWGKPVPSFGDPDAQLLLVGLAPAAHGANRTGRMFTGDSSGDWLYRAMFEAGFANQAQSNHSDDGLQLVNAYITAMNHCAPPQNKPTAKERSNCRPYLEREWAVMKDQLKVVLCLGGLAFTQFCKLVGVKGEKFGHHQSYPLNDRIELMTSYHPSQQNTNTGRLLWEDWLNVFIDIRKKLEGK